MKRVRLFLPAIAVLALLAMACSVCGNLAELRSGLGELSEQATALATVIPDAEAIQVTVEAELTQVAQGEVPTEAIEEIPTEAAAEDAEPESEQPEPAPQDAVEDEAQDEVQEPMDLDMSLASLDNLNSYRSDMTVRWEGTDNGEPSNGYMNVKYASVREPAAVQMDITGDDFGGSGGDDMGVVSFIQVEDTAWFYDSETDSWMQVPGGDLGFEEGFFFTPEDFLSEFEPSSGTRSPIPQNVNGVSCYKYTFSEKDFADMDPSEGEIRFAAGEAYVAVDGNYVVKLSMEIEMSNAYEDTDTFDEGTMWMDFELSDINQPIVIEPPAEALSQTQGREDIPQLPDAEVMSAMDTFIMYTTGSGVKEAADFYEQEMPANGWDTEGESMVMDDAAFLSYTKDGATVSIIISADETEGTSVMISIE